MIWDVFPVKSNIKKAFVWQKAKGPLPHKVFLPGSQRTWGRVSEPDNVERDLLTSTRSGTKQTWVRTTERHVNSRVLTLALVWFCDTESHKQAGRGGCSLKGVPHCPPCEVCSQAGVRERLPKDWWGQHYFCSLHREQHVPAPTAPGDLLEIIVMCCR